MHVYVALRARSLVVPMSACGTKQTMLTTSLTLACDPKRRLVFYRTRYHSRRVRKDWTACDRCQGIAFGLRETRNRGSLSQNGRVRGSAVLAKDVFAAKTEALTTGIESYADALKGRSSWSRTGRISMPASSRCGAIAGAGRSTKVRKHRRQSRPTTERLSWLP